MGMSPDKLPEHRPSMHEIPTTLSAFTNWDTFTILNYAINHAGKGHQVGTEHLLRSIAVNQPGLLNKIGGGDISTKTIVSLDFIRLDRLCVEPNNIEFIISARKALELAVIEAQNYGRSQVLPEDLLIGLIKSENSVAAGVLESLGVDENIARRAIAAHRRQKGI